jgi:hypothetical protein
MRLKSLDDTWAYFPYAPGPSTLGSNQFRQEAELRGGEVMSFTLAIFIAPDVARQRATRASMNGAASS